MSDVLAAALKLAERGLRVVPLNSPTPVGGCSCGKPDCADAGKHPRISGWPGQASTDPSVIKDWWQRWPEANLGVATGAGSGVMVLDVDPRHGGDDALHELEAEHGELPSTTSVLTGGGGVHYYFRLGQDVGNVDLAPGIEIKSGGRQVAAPPSLHPSGRRYEWEVSSNGLAPPPSWLLALVSAASRNGAAATIGDSIPKGERNATLMSLAGTMRRRGAGQRAILAALLATNEESCKPPLDRAEVERIAASAARYKPEPESESESEADGEGPFALEIGDFVAARQESPDPILGTEDDASCRATGWRCWSPREARARPRSWST